MPRHSPPLQVGDATVNILNVGDIQGPLSAWMDEPAAGWPPAIAARVKRSERFPTQCVHIALPGLSVLVDAGAYGWPPDSPFAIAGYEPPPPLSEQLRSEGIQPEHIQHVVITHPHHDHISGLAQDGRPCFPHARHYLARADWEQAALQAALQDPGTVEARTLGLLRREGLLDLIDGGRPLASDVTIVAAPGETPGHQIVRLRSRGQALYCVGDLYHHALEAERPELMARWVAPEDMLDSRRALLEAALREDARLVATHIPGAGRLQRERDAIRWVDSG